MKTIILLMVGLMALGSTSFAEGKRNDLRASQEKKALLYIDSICGDTWCEGNYDYEFTSLDCNFSAGTCVLGFKYWDTGSDSPRHKQTAHCEAYETYSFADIIETDRNYSNLNRDFYEKISDCVGSPR